MDILKRACASAALIALAAGCAVHSEDQGDYVVNGQWIAMGAKGVTERITGGGEAMKFYITLLRHPDAGPCVAPDNVIVLDGAGITLPLISPADYVTLLHGETSEDVVRRGAAAQMHASNQQLPTHTYGVIQDQGGGRYSYTADTRPSGGFASGMAAGMQGLPGIVAANQAAEIESHIREEARDALMPQTILPDAAISGRIWTVASEGPYAVNVMACGEHLEVLIDGERSTGRVRTAAVVTPPEQPVEPDEELMRAIEAHPDLAHWMDHDPVRWDLAVAFDSALLSQPRYEGVSTEERLGDVVKMVKEAMPENGE